MSSTWVTISKSLACTHVNCHGRHVVPSCKINIMICYGRHVVVALVISIFRCYVLQMSFTSTVSRHPKQRHSSMQRQTSQHTLRPFVQTVQANVRFQPSSTKEPRVPIPITVDFIHRHSHIYTFSETHSKDNKKKHWTKTTIYIRVCVKRNFVV